MTGVAHRRAGGAWPASLRGILLGVSVVAAMVAVYLLADLYLRVDLPGASALQQILFELLFRPVAFLSKNHEWRRALYGVVAILVLVALLRRSWWGRAAFTALFLLPCVMLVLTTVIGLLMERALGGGLVVALATCLACQRHLRDGAALRTGSGSGSSHERAVLALSLLVATCAVLYVIALLLASGDGYRLLDLAGKALREDDIDYLGAYYTVLAVLTLAGILGCLRASRITPAELARLLPGVVTGAGAALAIDRLMELHTPPASALLLVPCAVVLASLCGWPVFKGAAGMTWPVRLLRNLAFCGLLGFFLVGHAYAARVLRCTGTRQLPYLTLLARTPPAFRLALFDNGGRIAISMRNTSRLAVLRLFPPSTTITFTDSGPAKYLERSWQDWELEGFPEELVHVPSLPGFYATLIPSPSWERAFVHKMKLPPGARQQNQMKNWLLEVAPGGDQVLKAFPLPGICWISSMEWYESRRRLLMGCEYVPGLFTFDPVRQLEDQVNRDPRLGDVQGIAIDQERGQIYTASLWQGRRLCELDARSLQIKRTLPIGGVNYAIIRDGVRRRLYTSGFYASRVRVVDQERMAKLPSITTGLGTRALALHRRLGLLLVSSVYDGRLRLCGLEDNRVKGTLPVGGNIKAIAVDEERGLAYFSSQCGLFRLDLARWAQTL